MAYTRPEEGTYWKSTRAPWHASSLLNANWQALLWLHARREDRDQRPSTCRGTPYIGCARCSRRRRAHSSEPVPGAPARQPDRQSWFGGGREAFHIPEPPPDLCGRPDKPRLETRAGRELRRT